jgi:hypothetical protein
VIALLAACCLLGSAAQNGPIAQTTHFAFHSDFWLNLHHFLYVQARAKRGMDQGRPVVARVLADTAGFGALSDGERAQWASAATYYDRALATRDALFDSLMVDSKLRLSKVAEGGRLEDSGLDREWISALRSAEPVYRKLWWPRHDAANRAWAAQAVRLLAQHGDTIGNRVARAFRTQWPEKPIRVDVSAYTNWAEAYTTIEPSHIMVAHSTTTDDVLETLHHEVLHTMDRPLLNALVTAARSAGKRGAGNFIHPLIFYTAGEVTRQVIPAHQPFAEKAGMWGRSGFAPYRSAIFTHWQAFLEGKISFDAAIAELVKVLGSGAAP